MSFRIPILYVCPSCQHTNWGAWIRVSEDFPNTLTICSKCQVSGYGGAPVSFTENHKLLYRVLYELDVTDDPNMAIVLCAMTLETSLFDLYKKWLYDMPLLFNSELEKLQGEKKAAKQFKDWRNWERRARESHMILRPNKSMVVWNQQILATQAEIFTPRNEILHYSKDKSRPDAIQAHIRTRQFMDLLYNINTAISQESLICLQ